MESRKLVLMDRSAGQQWRCRYRKQTCGHSGERRRWDDELREGRAGGKGEEEEGEEAAEVKREKFPSLRQWCELSRRHTYCPQQSDRF